MTHGDKPQPPQQDGFVCLFCLFVCLFLLQGTLQRTGEWYCGERCEIHKESIKSYEATAGLGAEELAR